MAHSVETQIEDT